MQRLAYPFEVVGLASDGTEPYRSAVRALVANWADWLEPRIVAPPVHDDHAAVLAALAQVDGLLLLRNVGRAEAAEAAADVLTERGGDRTGASS